MVFINLKNELKTNDFFMVFMILSWFLGIFELFSNFSSGLLPMVFIKITFNIVPVVPVLEPERSVKTGTDAEQFRSYGISPKL